MITHGFVIDPGLLILLRRIANPATFFYLIGHIYHETKRNETKRNETKRNETKRNETKRNETKRNETKRNETKRNETKRTTKRNAVFTTPLICDKDIA